jgi:endo-1,4-beta-xylanase
LALGDDIAYTDDTDWITYSSVAFAADWDQFSVAYSKGNTEIWSISVHLDSLDNVPSLETELEPTSGWGSNFTLQLPLPAVTGVHAVFVRFNGVSGVANIDQLRFGKEVPTSGVDLVTNGHFETDSEGWYTWDGTLSVSTERAHSGAQSLVVSGSAATGPAALNLLHLAEPGVAYSVSFWVSVGGPIPTEINITQAMTCGDSTTYSWLSNSGSVPNDGWLELTGVLSVPADCDLHMLQVYAEGSAVVDLYVDDVSIKGPPPASPVNVVSNGNFETNTSGWFSWIGSVTSSNTKARSGAQSLLVSGPGTGRAATDLSAVVNAGKGYNTSFWVSVGNVPSAQVNLTLSLRCGDNTSYSWLANHTAVSTDGWTELAGTFAIPSDCASPGLMLFVEGGGTNVDLYVDDVTLTEVP